MLTDASNHDAVVFEKDALAMTAFDGMKVFCATTAQRRNNLGETVTDWLDANPNVEPVQATMLQSSDEAHHCVTMVLYYTGTPDRDAAVYPTRG